MMPKGTAAPTASRGFDVTSLDSSGAFVQVENHFRDIAFAHSAVLCCPGQTDASIPRTTASRSPGNLASSSVRRSVISFRCPS
jgi:hypothetical protein